MDEGNQITPIGKTNFRNNHVTFGIKDQDRLGHIYVLGKTGVGKSTLLLNMALTDIARGNGIGVIDPHGDLASQIISSNLNRRKNDLIYFDASSTNEFIAFNPLHGVHKQYHYLVASGIISTFKKIWADSWGPRLEYILRFVLLTLLSTPGATLLDIQPLLVNSNFRKSILSGIEDDHILSFWEQEFEKYPPSLRSEAIAPILNKTGLFLTSPALRNILGQRKSDFRMQYVIDEGKILIANLSKGLIGEETASLLGGLLINTIQLAALHRAKQNENARKPFYLYVDEMHTFVTLSFTSILSEARKYGLALFLTNQYIAQLDERVKASIFGNVGTLISFRVGAEDAEYLVEEFFPLLKKADLVALPKYGMYIKLQIDGATSQPFSATSLPLQHETDQRLSN